MKWKFASYLFMGVTLTSMVIPCIQAIGQSPIQKSDKPNTPVFQDHPAPSAGGQQSNWNPPPGSNSKVPNSVQGYYAPSVPPDFASGHNRKVQMMFIDKDGSINRIEKEVGTPFSQEEIRRSMEAKQKVQSAVAILKSPDADEATKKESKQLISKYLKAEFQWDQDARREQVERLEKQVEQIRKQLTKREASQDNLIELRMQLLENDASGLSFPDSWTNINIHPQPSHYGYSNPNTYNVPYVQNPSPPPNYQSRYPNSTSNQLVPRNELPGR